MPPAPRDSPGRLQALLALHQTLLADARRNRVFHAALRAALPRGGRVLDLGAGSGVWAVAAARLGAREVVAVERERLLLPVIRALARENGVAERVRVIAADARRLRLGRRFDLVVSETVGHEGFDEGLVALLARARERWLRPGGRLLPERLALWAAPARRRGLFAGRPRLAGGLRASSFAALAVHVPQLVPPSALRTLAPARRLLSVDLQRLPADYRVPTLRAAFGVRNAAAVEGLALWVEIGLGRGLSLSTRSGTHWTPCFLPFEDLPDGPRRLRCEVRLDPQGHGWSVSVAGDTRRYSPLFAFGALRAAAAGRARRPRLRGPRVRATLNR